MPPCLLLALALLGTASARLHVQDRRVPDGVPRAEDSHRNFHYAVVTKLHTYKGAQRHCREVLKGELASVHSFSRNQQLQELARTYTHRSLWIGAVTMVKGRQCESKWEDGTPWNYANWAPGQSCHLFNTCTALSPRDGLWRRRFCFQLRAFICQY